MEEPVGARPSVVMVGAGFGGLRVARGLSRAPVWLIGFRNRMLVLVNWAWNYLTYDRAVRLIRRTASRQRISNHNEEAP